MTEPIQTPPVRRSRRRWSRIALVSLALLAALVWFTPTVIAHTNLRNKIVGRALADLNGTVASGSASMSWFGPIELRDVTLTEASGRVAIRSPKLTTSKTLWQLATQRRDLGTFHIEDPEVIVAAENGSTNLEDLLVNFLKDDGTPPKAERLGFALEASGGRVAITGKPEAPLHNVSFSFRSPISRAEPMEIRFAGESPSAGKLEGTLILGVENSAKLTAAAFPLDWLTPLLPRVMPGLELGGSFTAELAGKWRSAGEQPMTVEASGSGSVADFSLRAPPFGGETLALKSLALLPSEVRTLESGAVEVKALKILCDAGDATLAGRFDPGAGLHRLLNQPGVSASAHLDLAKLAELLPKLLSLRTDTAIQRGSVDLTLKSEATPAGALWTGDVKTGDLEARRGPQALSWKTPLVGNFRLRFRPDDTPEFEEVQLLSEFLSIAARGEPENFSAAGRFDLRKLAAQLGQFVDFGALKLEGEGIFRLSSKPGAGSPSAELGGSIDLTHLDIRNGPRILFAEPEVHLKLDAVVKRLGDSALRIDSSNLRLSTNEQHPELERIRLRGTITGTLGAKPEGYRGEKLIVDLQDVRFAGSGLNVDEPSLRLTGDASFDRQTQSLTLTGVHLASATLMANSALLNLKTGEVSGALSVDALQLERLQKTFNLLSDPHGADVCRGIAKGTIQLKTTEGKAGFEVDCRVEPFAYGPVAKPAWSEPWIAVKGGGHYDFTLDTLTLRGTKIARDGFALDATGTASALSTAMELNLAGNLTYDLAKIEPQLKEYLGKAGQATGQGTKPFALSGNFADGGKNLAVKVGEGPKKNLDHLKGTAGLGWTSLKAYGFDVGQAEVKASVGDGLVKMNRVEAVFGSGKVRLEPTLALNPGRYDLTFAKGMLVERAKLSPAACADALGYALPAIANAAQAEGTISFELGDNRFPLVAPTTGSMAGVLVIHDAEVSPGPVVAKIAELFGSQPLKLPLAKEQRVPIEFRDGRVYHRDFAITVDGYTVKTSGSVGVDGTLALVLEIPLAGKLSEAMVPAEQPKVRAALAKQSVKVSVGGTLTKPQVDPKTFHNLLADTVRNAAKEYARSAADDLIQKGLQKFLPKK